MPQRLWEQVAQELLFLLKAHKKAIRRAAVNTFGYIAKAIGPMDVFNMLLSNLKVCSCRRYLLSFLVVIFFAAEQLNRKKQINHPPSPTQVQERQQRVCTTVAIAIVAETCEPYTGMLVTTTSLTPPTPPFPALLPHHHEGTPRHHPEHSDFTQLPSPPPPHKATVSHALRYPPFPHSHPRSAERVPRARDEHPARSAEGAVLHV